MPDQESAATEPRDIPVDLFPEAPVSIDLKNPAGWMLHLRSRTVDGVVTKLNELFDPDNGERTELTNVLLQSFNPAFIASMIAGQSAQEALGYEPEQEAQDAYEALQAGAKRAPRPSGGGGGTASRPSGGGDSDDESFPQWFKDSLDNGTCVECGGDDFWDNRSKIKDGTYSKKSPHFKCKEKSCEHAYWPPKEGGARSRGSRGD